jgi:hypothetical protein
LSGVRVLGVGGKVVLQMGDEYVVWLIDALGDSEEKCVAEIAGRAGGSALRPFWEDHLAAVRTMLAELRAFRDKDDPLVCHWRLAEEMWETECGKGFVFIDGDPDQNGLLFCPYCGGQLGQIVEVVAGFGETTTA